MPADAGNLGFVNSHGSGAIEDPALLRFWDRAGEWLTGRAPQLTLCSPATSPGSTAIDDVLGQPAERVTCFDDGAVIERPIVVRFHAVATEDGIAVVPGGNGRVIEAFDNPLLPTPCRAKDVWILGDAPPQQTAVPVVSAPQVDFITSVPTRAADSLYWLCRAAERAEAVARSLRVLESAPPVASWSGAPRPTLNLLIALAGQEADVTQVGRDDDVWSEVRWQAITAATSSIEFHVGSMLAESASVREFLSATTGRVLAEMVESRHRLAAAPNDVEAIDALLFQLSAFGGLWSESVVRGPAWYFGDFAKRYERTLIALTGASAAIHIARLDETHDVDRRRGLEGVLASNDSLVAYRRRHRSDVELEAVLGLLLHDERNPRSFAASISGMLRNASAIGWSAGIERIEEIGREVDTFTVAGDLSTLDEVAERLHALAAELTSTRLVAPPNPTLVRPRIVDPGAVA